MTGKGDAVRTRQVLDGYVAKIEVNPKDRCIDTSLYREALSFLPKDLLDGDEIISMIDHPANNSQHGGNVPEAKLDLKRAKTHEDIEKPELTIANWSPFHVNC